MFTVEKSGMYVNQRDDTYAGTAHDWPADGSGQLQLLWRAAQAQDSCCRLKQTQQLINNN